MKPCKGDELPAVPELAKALDVGFLLVGRHGRCGRMSAQDQDFTEVR